MTAGRDVVVTGAAKPGATAWIDVVGRAVADGRGSRAAEHAEHATRADAIVAASATRGLDLGRGCIVVIIPARPPPAGIGAGEEQAGRLNPG